LEIKISTHNILEELTHWGLGFSLATKASSMAYTSKLRHVDLGYYLDGWTSKENCMGTVNPSPFVGVANCNQSFIYPNSADGR
jgi:hypothetical protein